MTHGSLFSGIGGFDLATEWIVSHRADTGFEDMPRRAESADAYRHAAKRQGTADIGGDVQIGVTTNASGILLQGCAARPMEVQPRRSDNWTNSSICQTSNRVIYFLT